MNKGSRDRVQLLKEISLTNFNKNYDDRYWRIEKFEVLHNKNLEKRWEEYKRKLAFLGRSDDLKIETYVFSVETEKSIKDIVQYGPKVGTKLRHLLGDPAHGVHLVSNFDILTRYMAYQQYPSPSFVVVYKACLGKSKPTAPCLRKDDIRVQPHKDIDSLVAATKIENTMLICEALSCSLVYIFEYDGISQVKYPRQVLPYAIIKLEKKMRIIQESPFTAVATHQCSYWEVKGETRRGFRFMFTKSELKGRRKAPSKQHDVIGDEISQNEQLHHKRTKTPKVSKPTLRDSIKKSENDTSISSENVTEVNKKDLQEHIQNSRFLNDYQMLVQNKCFDLSGTDYKKLNRQLACKPYVKLKRLDSCVLKSFLGSMSKRKVIKSANKVCTKNLVVASIDDVKCADNFQQSSSNDANNVTETVINKSIDPDNPKEVVQSVTLQTAMINPPNKDNTNNNVGYAENIQQSSSFDSNNDTETVTTNITIDPVNQLKEVQSTKLQTVDECVSVNIAMQSCVESKVRSISSDICNEHSYSIRSTISKQTSYQTSSESIDSGGNLAFSTTEDDENHSVDTIKHFYIDNTAFSKTAESQNITCVTSQYPEKNKFESDKTDKCCVLKRLLEGKTDVQNKTFVDDKSCSYKNKLTAYVPTVFQISNILGKHSNSSKAAAEHLNVTPTVDSQSLTVCSISNGASYNKTSHINPTNPGSPNGINNDLHAPTKESLKVIENTRKHESSKPIAYLNNVSDSNFNFDDNVSNKISSCNNIATENFLRNVKVIKNKRKNSLRVSPSNTLCSSNKSYVVLENIPKNTRNNSVKDKSQQNKSAFIGNVSKSKIEMGLELFNENFGNTNLVPVKHGFVDKSSYKITNGKCTSSNSSAETSGLHKSIGKVNKNYRPASDRNFENVLECAFTLTHWNQLRQTIPEQSYIETTNCETLSSNRDNINQTIALSVEKSSLNKECKSSKSPDTVTNLQVDNETASRAMNVLCSKFAAVSKMAVFGKSNTLSLEKNGSPTTNFQAVNEHSTLTSLKQNSSVISDDFVNETGHCTALENFHEQQNETNEAIMEKEKLKSNFNQDILSSHSCSLKEEHDHDSQDTVIGGVTMSPGKYGTLENVSSVGYLMEHNFRSVLDSPFYKPDNGHIKPEPTDELHDEMTSVHKELNAIPSGLLNCHETHGCNSDHSVTNLTQLSDPSCKIDVPHSFIQNQKDYVIKSMDETFCNTPTRNVEDEVLNLNVKQEPTDVYPSSTESNRTSVTHNNLVKEPHLTKNFICSKLPIFPRHQDINVTSVKECTESIVQTLNELADMLRSLNESKENDFKEMSFNINEKSNKVSHKEILMAVEKPDYESQHVVVHNANMTISENICSEITETENKLLQNSKDSVISRKDDLLTAIKETDASGQLHVHPFVDANKKNDGDYLPTQDHLIDTNNRNNDTDNLPTQDHMVDANNRNNDADNLHTLDRLVNANNRNNDADNLPTQDHLVDASRNNDADNLPKQDHLVDANNRNNDADNLPTLDHLVDANNRNNDADNLPMLDHVVDANNRNNDADNLPTQDHLVDANNRNNDLPTLFDDRPTLFDPEGESFITDLELFGIPKTSSKHKSFLNDSEKVVNVDNLPVDLNSNQTSYYQKSPINLKARRFGLLYKKLKAKKTWFNLNKRLLKRNANKIVLDVKSIKPSEKSEMIFQNNSDSEIVALCKENLTTMEATASSCDNSVIYKTVCNELNIIRDDSATKIGIAHYPIKLHQPSVENSSINAISLATTEKMNNENSCKDIGTLLNESALLNESRTAAKNTSIKPIIRSIVSKDKTTDRKVNEQSKQYDIPFRTVIALKAKQRRMFHLGEASSKLIDYKEIKKKLKSNKIDSLHNTVKSSIPMSKYPNDSLKTSNLPSSNVADHHQPFKFAEKYITGTEFTKNNVQDLVHWNTNKKSTDDYKRKKSKSHSSERSKRRRTTSSDSECSKNWTGSEKSFRSNKSTHKLHEKHESQISERKISNDSNLFANNYNKHNQNLNHCGKTKDYKTKGVKNKYEINKFNVVSSQSEAPVDYGFDAANYRVITATPRKELHHTSFSKSGTGYFHWKKKYQPRWGGRDELVVTKKGSRQTVSEFEEWKRFADREKLRKKIETAIQEYKKTFENLDDDSVGFAKVSSYLQYLTEKFEHPEEGNNKVFPTHWHKKGRKTDEYLENCGLDAAIHSNEKFKQLQNDLKQYQKLQETSRYQNFPITSFSSPSSDSIFDNAHNQSLIAKGIDIMWQEQWNKHYEQLTKKLKEEITEEILKEPQKLLKIMPASKTKPNIDCYNKQKDKEEYDRYVYPTQLECQRDKDTSTHIKSSLSKYGDKRDLDFQRNRQYEYSGKSHNQNIPKSKRHCNTVRGRSVDSLQRGSRTIEDRDFKSKEKYLLKGSTAFSNIHLQYGAVHSRDTFVKRGHNAKKRDAVHMWKEPKENPKNEQESDREYHNYDIYYMDRGNFNKRYVQSGIGRFKARNDNNYFHRNSYLSYDKARSSDSDDGHFVYSDRHRRKQNHFMHKNRRSDDTESFEAFTYKNKLQLTAENGHSTNNYRNTDLTIDSKHDAKCDSDKYKKHEKKKHSKEYKKQKR